MDLFVADQAQVKSDHGKDATALLLLLIALSSLLYLDVFYISAVYIF